jgi:CheY-like chemotaxis protein
VQDVRPIVVIEENADDIYFVKRLLGRAGISNPIIAFERGPAAIQALERMATADQKSLRRAVLCDWLAWKGRT